MALDGGRVDGVEGPPPAAVPPTPPTTPRTTKTTAAVRPFFYSCPEYSLSVAEMSDEEGALPSPAAADTAAAADRRDTDQQQQILVKKYECVPG